MLWDQVGLDYNEIKKRILIEDDNLYGMFTVYAYVFV